MNSKSRAAAIAGLLLASPAAAQQAGPFTGPHVGAGVTAVDHHFVLEESNASGSDSRNVRKWGVGGAAFAGYDVALSERVVAGVGAMLDFGGRTASTRTTSGDRIALDPRYGFSVSARLGYAVDESLLAYAKAGYGEHHYRTTLPSGSEPFDGSAKSFVVGGGLEYRLARSFSLRAEFEHLDGSRNQFMVGVPIRF